MYRNKRFTVRPFDEVLEDIREASREFPETRRVFLADGDAMILSTERLLPILEALRAHFPLLSRVGIYADTHGINKKTEKELEALKSHKLGIIYLGLESGSDKVLRRIRKHCTAAEMTAGVLKAKSAGIKTSVIGLLGIGGKELTEEHARETGRVISAMSPTYFSALTLTLVPGTELLEEAQRGQFQPLTPLESLDELAKMVEGINPPRPIIFRTNHASNYLALEGTLPKDKDAILKAIRFAVENRILKPEALRGL